MTWEATLKPYKHQITHLGRVDIVISAEKFLFLLGKFQLEEREKPDGRAQTYPTYPVMIPDQARSTDTWALQIRVGETHFEWYPCNLERAAANFSRYIRFSHK